MPPQKRQAYGVFLALLVCSSELLPVLSLAANGESHGERDERHEGNSSFSSERDLFSQPSEVVRSLADLGGTDRGAPLRRAAEVETGNNWEFPSVTTLAIGTDMKTGLTSQLTVFAATEKVLYQSIIIEAKGSQFDANHGKPKFLANAMVKLVKNDATRKECAETQFDVPVGLVASQSNAAGSQAATSAHMSMTNSRELELETDKAQLKKADVQIVFMHGGLYRLCYTPDGTFEQGGVDDYNNLVPTKINVYGLSSKCKTDGCLSNERWDCFFAYSSEWREEANCKFIFDSDATGREGWGVTRDVNGKSKMTWSQAWPADELDAGTGKIKTGNTFISFAKKCASGEPDTTMFESATETSGLSNDEKYQDIIPNQTPTKAGFLPAIKSTVATPFTLTACYCPNYDNCPNDHTKFIQQFGIIYYWTLAICDYENYLTCTTPYMRVIPQQRFVLKVLCPPGGGCEGSTANRIKIIDPLADHRPSYDSTHGCRAVSQESDSAVWEARNKNGGVRADYKAWRDTQVSLDLSLNVKKDVCYCNSGCGASQSWFKVGVVKTVTAFLFASKTKAHSIKTIQYVNKPGSLSFYGGVTTPIYECYTYGTGENDAWCQQQSSPFHYNSQVAGGGQNTNFPGCGVCMCCKDIRNKDVVMNPYDSNKYSGKALINIMSFDRELQGSSIDKKTLEQKYAFDKKEENMQQFMDIECQTERYSLTLLEGPNTKNSAKQYLAKASATASGVDNYLSFSGENGGKQMTIKKAGVVAVCYCARVSPDNECVSPKHWLYVGRMTIRGPQGGQEWIFPTNTIVKMEIFGWGLDHGDKLRVISSSASCSDNNHDPVGFTKFKIGCPGATCRSALTNEKITLNALTSVSTGILIKEVTTQQHFSTLTFTGDITKHLKEKDTITIDRKYIQIDTNVPANMTLKQAYDSFRFASEYQYGDDFKADDPAKMGYMIGHRLTNEACPEAEAQDEEKKAQCAANKQIEPQKMRIPMGSKQMVTEGKDLKLLHGEGHWTRRNQMETHQNIKSVEPHEKLKVCWGVSEGVNHKFYAQAGEVTFTDTTTMKKSAVSLSTKVNGQTAPIVISFTSSPYAKYAGAPGSEPVMMLVLRFLDVHEKLVPKKTGDIIPDGKTPDDIKHDEVVTRDDRRQNVCGMLFSEMWSNDDEGFPVADGCYYGVKYKNAADTANPFPTYWREFIISFQALNGLKHTCHSGGKKVDCEYQIVMNAQVNNIKVNDQLVEMYTQCVHGCARKYTLFETGIAKASISTANKASETEPAWGSQGFQIQRGDANGVLSLSDLNIFQVRLRGGNGPRSIQAGALVKVFLSPLTQWNLGSGKCMAECSQFSQDSMRRVWINTTHLVGPTGKAFFEDGLEKKYEGPTGKYFFLPKSEWSNMVGTWNNGDVFWVVQYRAPQLSRLFEEETKDEFEVGAKSFIQQWWDNDEWRDGEGDGKMAYGRRWKKSEQKWRLDVTDQSTAATDPNNEEIWSGMIQVWDNKGGKTDHPNTGQWHCHARRQEDAKEGQWRAGDIIKIRKLSKCSGYVDCHPKEVVAGSNRRNIVRLKLPANMESIDNNVMHTIKVTNLVLPLTGFFPTRCGVELTKADDTAPDFTTSTGYLYKKPSKGQTTGRIVAMDRSGYGPLPFYADEGNTLHLRLSFGATLWHNGNVPDWHNQKEKDWTSYFAIVPPHILKTSAEDQTYQPGQTDQPGQIPEGGPGVQFGAKAGPEKKGAFPTAEGAPDLSLWIPTDRSPTDFFFRADDDGDGYPDNSRGTLLARKGCPEVPQDLTDAQLQDAAIVQQVKDATTCQESEGIWTALEKANISPCSGCRGFNAPYLYRNMRTNNVIYAGQVVYVRISMTNPLYALQKTSGCVGKSSKTPEDPCMFKIKLSSWGYGETGKFSGSITQYDMEETFISLAEEKLLNEGKKKYWGGNVPVLTDFLDYTIQPSRDLTRSTSARHVNQYINVFFRTARSAGRGGYVILDAPPGFDFKRNCNVQDLDDTYYAFTGEDQPRTMRLKGRADCEGEVVFLRSNFLSAEKSYRTASVFNRARIKINGMLAEKTTYAFKIMTAHPETYLFTQHNSWRLWTQDENGYGIDGSRTTVPFNRNMRMLCTTDKCKDWGVIDNAFNNPDGNPQDMIMPWHLSYGMFDAASKVQVKVADATPKSLTEATTSVTVYPIEVKADVTTSIRITAPDGYEWDAEDTKFMPQANASTANFPTKGEDGAPAYKREKRINEMTLKNIKLLKGKVYGFKAQISVPSKSPTASTNAFFVEVGYNEYKETSKRLMAAVIPGPPVKALTNVVISYMTNKEGERENYLEFHVQTASALSPGQGMVVKGDSYTNGFSFICPPLHIEGEPPSTHLPEVECMDENDDDKLPLVMLKAKEDSIPPGFYKFEIKAKNPTSSSSIAGKWTFGTYKTIKSPAPPPAPPESESSPRLLQDNAPAPPPAKYSGPVDVPLTTPGFTVNKGMEAAEMVKTDQTQRKMTNRNDRPNMPNHLIFAFKLKGKPAKTEDLKLRGPRGFVFHEDCLYGVETNANKVFGPDTGSTWDYDTYIQWPSKFKPIKCVGLGSFASITIPAGLDRSNMYVFRIAVAQNPPKTPRINKWTIDYASQSSDPIPGFRLWTFTEDQVAPVSTAKTNTGANIDRTENPVRIIFMPSKEIPRKCSTCPSGGLLRIIAPKGFIFVNQYGECKVRLNERGSDYAFAATQLKCVVEKSTNLLLHVTGGRAIMADKEYSLVVDVYNPAGTIEAENWLLESFTLSTPEEKNALDWRDIPGFAINNVLNAWHVKNTKDIVNGKVQVPDILFTMRFPDSLKDGDTLEVHGPRGFYLIGDPDRDECNEFKWPADEDGVRLSPLPNSDLPKCTCDKEICTVKFEIQEGLDPAYQQNREMQFELSTWNPSKTPFVTDNFWTVKHMRGKVIKSSHVFESWQIKPQLEKAMLWLAGNDQAAGSTSDIIIEFVPVNNADTLMLEAVAPSGFDFSKAMVNPPYDVDDASEGEKIIINKANLISGKNSKITINSVKLGLGGGASKFHLITYKDETMNEKMDELLNFSGGFRLPGKVTITSKELKSIYTSSATAAELYPVKSLYPARIEENARAEFTIMLSQKVFASHKLVVQCLGKGKYELQDSDFIILGTTTIEATVEKNAAGALVATLMPGNPDTQVALQPDTPYQVFMGVIPKEGANRWLFETQDGNAYPTNTNDGKLEGFQPVAKMTVDVTAERSPPRAVIDIVLNVNRGSAIVKQLVIVAPPDFIFPPDNCGDMCQAGQVLGTTGRKTAVISSPTGEALTALSDLKIKVQTPEKDPDSLDWYVEGRGQGAGDTTGWGEKPLGFRVTQMLGTTVSYAGVASLQGSRLTFTFTLTRTNGQVIAVEAPDGYQMSCSSEGALAQISLPGSLPDCTDDPLTLTLNQTLVAGDYAFGIVTDIPAKTPENNKFNLIIRDRDGNVVDANYGIPGKEIAPSMKVGDPRLSWTRSEPGQPTTIAVEITFDQDTDLLKAFLISFPDNFIHDIQKPTDVMNLNKKFPVASSTTWIDVVGTDRIRILLDDTEEMTTIKADTYTFSFPVLVPCCTPVDMPRNNVWYLSLCQTRSCLRPTDPTVIVALPMAGFNLGQLPGDRQRGALAGSTKTSINGVTIGVSVGAAIAANLL